MEKTKVQVSQRNIHKYAGDLVVFLAAQGGKDELICADSVRPLVDTAHRLGDFTGKENEVMLSYPKETQKKTNFAAARVLVVGLGKKEEKRTSGETADLFRNAGGTISGVCEKCKVTEALITTEPLLGMKTEGIAEWLTEGILLGDYRFNRYKKEDDEKDSYPGLEKLTVHAAKRLSAVKSGVQQAESISRAVVSARDMANEPGNGWTAAHFADYGKKLSRKYSIKCRIIDKPEMKKLGMGGILAVNKGSAEPPKLVILDYNPGKKSDTILLVGKGLTFDSGGISLKPALGMQDMKYDMCGGAAVIAAMQAIAREKLPVRVVALIPSTDNMSGSSAVKPGDIIRHYGGMTSEIVNTDAEGRLILADAMGYGIEKFNPDCLVDVATLTGAVIIGLGHHHTGLLSNDDKLAGRLIEAGKRSGEPLWRLPLGKEYSKQIDSKVADVKNAGGKPAGTITAAAYLEKFVGETSWAHLDIAGTAWEFTEKKYIPKGPSGIMVRTLFDFVRNWK